MARILAVGDLHTKLWVIEEVEKVAEPYDKVIFVGDYADDWGKEPIDSIKTWQKLKELHDTNPNKYIMLMGNHDFIYVNKTNTLQGGYNTSTQMLINSPDFKELKTWVSALPIKYKLDDVTYSHAGIVNEWDGKTYWADFSPIWVRPNDMATYSGKQVFGHTPSQTCWEVQPNVWCIDTFSTYPNGSVYGDGTVLEVIDGKYFNIRKLIK